MALGTVIRSFAGPSNNLRGMCWNGRFLWVSDDWANVIALVDPVTGTVHDTIVPPANSVGALAWDGVSLWYGDWGTNTIYQFNPNTNS